MIDETDTTRTIEEKQFLEELRRPFAEIFWVTQDLPEIAESENWDVDGRFWTRVVYWEPTERFPDDSSRKGSFSLEFDRDSVEIIDHWIS